MNDETYSYARLMKYSRVFLRNYKNQQHRLTLKRCKMMMKSAMSFARRAEAVASSSEDRDLARARCREADEIWQRLDRSGHRGLRPWEWQRLRTGGDAPLNREALKRKLRGYAPNYDPNGFRAR